MNLKFRDRRDAGRRLAGHLQHHAGRTDTVVLALPRGGVPVAYEIASVLRAPLDLFIVRKLGVPGQRELAMGAIATGGVQVLNHELIDALGIPASALEVTVAAELLELHRREIAYRGRQPALAVQGRAVILVDDGIATGATLRAAIEALEKQRPAKLIVAVPAAAAGVAAALRAEVDDLVTLVEAERFSAVGDWYEDFSQTPDDEVVYLLEHAKSFCARRVS